VRLAVAVLAVAALAPAGRAAAGTPSATAAPAGTGPPPPTPAQCAGVRAHRTLAPVAALHRRGGGLRVFAMQFKQEPANVASYAAFRRKVECDLLAFVVPNLSRTRPNVVVFPEDVGLMTIGTGTRGAAVRALLRPPLTRLGCEGQAVPCATLAALGAVGAAYAPQLAYDRLRLGGVPGLSDVFLAATDTFARGWMQTFSDLARRYGVYLAGSNNQAPFRASSAPADIALLADPDVPRPAEVYVPTSAAVYNEAFLWGPRDVRDDGPPMLRNVVASNRKVPLTPIEQSLGLTPGPATGPEAIRNLRPFRVPGTRARLGFATSLPAFVYGDLPPGGDPCADVSRTYMRCLDRLGTNVVLQDEANPGRWTGADGDGVEQWQPLSWMTSTWRATSDPSVRFAYNVTPMLVGNLADLAFDGQSAITQRGLRGRRCHYVGNAAWTAAEDREDLRSVAGAQRGFLALAPWVARDALRSDLRATGARLAPGSGDALEGDYLETALIADLPFPPDPRRTACRTRTAPPLQAVGAAGRLPSGP
jgi:hypothetical protein